jgi:sulfide:quinone oxidoreductase
MANILVLGGGFAGVTAAEQLALELGREHQITLVSRSHRFIFYPALVRVAFEECEPEDVAFDLRETLMEAHVRFVQGEVARIDPDKKRVMLAHGDVAGEMPYDFLLYAPGRRLATENTPGFYEHANHLLTVPAALKFGEAIKSFQEGSIVFGNCLDSRLAVPVYETAFAMSRLLEKRGTRAHSQIRLALPATPGDLLGEPHTAQALIEALAKHDIDILLDFAPARVNEKELVATDWQTLPFDLLMLVPAFRGPGFLLSATGLTDKEGYLRVDEKMRVPGVENMYAAGDATDFPGPKMGHMAVRQALVAATNLAAEVKGHAPEAVYQHEMRFILDEGGEDSIYVRQRLMNGEPAHVRQGLFWRWAKRLKEKSWLAQHS